MTVLVNEAGAALGMDARRQVNAVSNRLSLRPPQRESLEVLARLGEILPLRKDQDVARALAAVRAEFPSVEDFERDFPSLCFNLATGVGKTRLMGAAVAYLHRAHNVRHFFVLAPSLTIYEKLQRDFTPGTPKYVLGGISEFAANPPEIITGDNYESGRGVRGGDLFGEGAVHINIFNIGKINSEVRGGAAPRIKRLQEYIGESYFDYLAGLDDLVLLMDESHRYRASAGVRAINELKPVLGLELTATPQVEAGNRIIPFRNVIYSYPLARAMADGFVKEPTVATRQNFDPQAQSAEELERMKLTDGIVLHEQSKAELETYALQHGLPRVKPFMLVVAQDVAHAARLVSIMEGDDFFDAQYRGRVITVHSGLRGEEKDETVQQLLTVENPENPTEVVVHVNMLKEGWDVTNLFTIVPLRAANARTLVEQTIGRGLRLPYGRRTGVSAVDRLTIVAHDKFQDIVDEANNPDSVLRHIATLYLPPDGALERKQAHVVKPRIEEEIVAGATPPAAPGQAGRAPLHLPTEADREVARAAIEAVRRLEYLPTSELLKRPEYRAKLVAEVNSRTAQTQTEMEGLAERPDVDRIVGQVVERLVELTIDVPRIVVQPRGEVAVGYDPFTLVLNARPQPVEHDILLQSLQTNTRERVQADGGFVPEADPRNYIVRALMNFDDISYDAHADLLYDLAGQVVAHLRGYLPGEDAIVNVLAYHQRMLAGLVHAQMTAHRWERAVAYDVAVTGGFTTLRSAAYSVAAGETLRPFRDVVEERQYIRGMLFGPFGKCLYPAVKFDSDSERRFAVLLEDEGAVLKWFRPQRGAFRIFHGRDQSYEPDFVVETATEKLLCEPKRADQVNTDDVQSKARAAAEWCRHATEHERAHGGKRWRYLLIPHDQITASTTLAALAARFEVGAQ